MRHIIRLLLFLIAVSSLLLLSDLHNREGTSHSKEKTRIALFRITSSQIPPDLAVRADTIIGMTIKVK
jgi:hypothetical protein